MAKSLICAAALLWSADQGLRFISIPSSWRAPEELHLGEPLLVPHLPRLKEAWLAGRPMTFLPKSSQWMAIVPSGRTQLTLYFDAEIQYGKKSVPFSDFNLVAISPVLESAPPLRLPAQVWMKMDSKHEPERLRDREKLTSLLSDTSGTFSNACWQLPSRGKVTSAFASPRRLPDGRAYLHTGQDHRAAIGTSVYASGPGQIRFAGNMLVPGGNILIAHGDGWFSRYLHLSRLLVKDGETVQRGQLIGYSGASGRVEAPHLHWEVLWRGIHADPGRFLPVWGRLCDRGLAARNESN